MTNTKLFLLLGTSLSLISSVSYGSYINKEALYALPEDLGRVGEGVKENSSIVIARRTLSDAAIQSTHPNPLYQEREYREQATASLPLIGKKFPNLGTRRTQCVSCPNQPTAIDRIKRRPFGERVLYHGRGALSGE